jgi:hypothetical protein
MLNLSKYFTCCNCRLFAELLQDPLKVVTCFNMEILVFILLHKTSNYVEQTTNFQCQKKRSEEEETITE